VSVLIVIWPRLKISDSHNLIGKVLHLVLLDYVLDPEPVLDNVLHLQLPSNNFLLFLLDLVAEPKELPRILSEVHNHIVGITDDEDAVFDGNNGGAAVVGDALDRVQVQDKAVTELARVVEVEEELHGDYVVIEVFDMNVADLAKYSWHALLLEPFNEEFMIHPH
jgi:hypothetical protein